MTFSQEQVIEWMQGVREHPDMINAFWPSQVNSKVWLSEWINSYLPGARKIIIFGCWYGVLADIIKTKRPEADIVCVDKDPEPIAWTEKKYESYAIDMRDYVYRDPVSCVINTSTEHMTQDEYDEWYSNIPGGTYFVIQGNNDFKEHDHVRATQTLEQFNNINRVKNCLRSEYIEYEGPWDHIDNVPTTYKRFMTIGFKDHDRKN